MSNKDELTDIEESTDLQPMPALKGDELKEEKEGKTFEVNLVQCILIDNQYQQISEVLYTFMSNKSYAYLLNFEPSNLVFFENL